jgi:arginase
MRNIQLISAPSILGLKPSGTEGLAQTLLHCGLAEKLQTLPEVIYVPVLNAQYNTERDPVTHCINTRPLLDFSAALNKVIRETLDDGCFAFALGGDCSVLLGIMPALKTMGTYSLVFMDAHADFYEPEKSLTGETADMDLALITGRGPEMLTNIHQLRPYVKDEHVLHIGQRDWEETQHYGSQDIRQTGIQCFDLAHIRQQGINTVVTNVLQELNNMQTDGCWIHFDTDVLSDEINPAVDYRIPGGLSFNEAGQLIQGVLSTGKAVGISVTIFNPLLDKDGTIAQQIITMLTKAFS